MKKTWLAVSLFLGFGLLCFSCGGKGEKTQSSTPIVSDSVEMETLSTTDSEPETEDDGDPNIKAASTDRMKVVVDNRGNLVGRYVQTNQTTFTVSVQDNVEVPRLGHKIVECRAKDGQGIIYTLRTNVNVRTQPNLESTIICQITTKKGETPTTYPCLGKTKGWYKIRIRGTEGYVRHDLVIWDAMNTF